LRLRTSYDHSSEASFSHDTSIVETTAALETTRESVADIRSVLSMKVRELIRLLQNDGWYLVQTRGSHRQYKHAQKRGRVTVPGHLNDDIARGTLRSVLKQAEITL
jgi:predicted RNA binding protein YcfA (HicA-like mRNA interferase family)